MRMHIRHTTQDVRCSPLGEIQSLIVSYPSLPKADTYEAIRIVYSKRYFSFSDISNCRTVIAEFNKKYYYLCLVWTKTDLISPKCNDNSWTWRSGKTGVRRGCLISLICTRLNGTQSAEQTFKIKRRLVADSVMAGCEYSEWRGIKARQSRVTLAWCHFLCCTWTHIYTHIHTHTHTFKTCKLADAYTRLAINEALGHQYALKS